MLDNSNMDLYNLQELMSNLSPIGLLSKQEIIEVFSKIIMDELVEFNIFSLEDIVLMSEDYWYNISTGVTNIKDKDNNCSFSFFIEACFSDLDTIISCDIRCSIDVCCYYLFCLYYVLSGDYYIHYDDIKRIGSFKLNKDRTIASYNSCKDYIQTVINSRPLSLSNSFTIL